MSIHTIKELEKQIKELKQINSNQQELIVDYEQQLKYLSDIKSMSFEENILTILLINHRIEKDNILKKNIIEEIKIPCWEFQPVKYAEVFQHIYYSYEYMYHCSWFKIDEIIILSKSYKYIGYDLDYNNMEYINKKIDYSILVSKYEEIKEKYNLKNLII